MKPIPDKAEVALEYPDKLYIGTFERSSDFDAHIDATGIALTLHHGGDEIVRKSVRLHIHCALFAEILADLAGSVGKLDKAHRAVLAQSATALATALRDKSSVANDLDDMMPEEEVALLHVLE